MIDDSEGEEADRTRKIVARHQGGPVPVEYLHREYRAGFKAGALNFGTARTEADLIALLDAEFVPRADFLLKTVPFFQDTRVGCVQGRFEYLNADHSPLTQLQAALFDKMLCSEAAVRSFLGLPTLSLAGGSVWRKSTIVEVGGWQEAPFTSEDIDLSLRTALAGWFILYQHEEIAWAELPTTFLAYKVQQRRWARGVFRCFLDHGLSALRRRQWRMALLDGSLIMLQGAMPLLVPLYLLTLSYVIAGFPRTTLWLVTQVVLSALFVAPPIMVELVFLQWRLYSDWPARVARLIRAFPLAIGLSVSLLAGFLDTAIGKRIEFIRTPKQTAEGVIGGSKKKWLSSVAWISAVEVALGVIGILGFTLALQRGYIESLVPILSLTVGYLAAGAVSFRERARLSAG